MDISKQIKMKSEPTDSRNEIEVNVEFCGICLVEINKCVYNQAVLRSPCFNVNKYQWKVFICRVFFACVQLSIRYIAQN